MNANLSAILEITDIYRGAYLMAKGAIIEGIKIKNNGRQMVTFLLKGEGLEKLDFE
ncbi:MAG: hypothetical protein HQK76_20595, partial [Desulfobacterales bacterium]|nr:hypothetical protein [Desulfobacterales bacterium]